MALFYITDVATSVCVARRAAYIAKDAAYAPPAPGSSARRRAFAGDGATDNSVELNNDGGCCPRTGRTKIKTPAANKSSSRAAPGAKFSCRREKGFSVVRVLVVKPGLIILPSAGRGVFALPGLKLYCRFAATGRLFSRKTGRGSRNGRTSARDKPGAFPIRRSHGWRVAVARAGRARPEIAS